jgi:predicted nucleotidyltransferase
VLPEDLARTLIERERAARQLRERRSEELRAAVEAWVREAKAGRRLERAWLIGSLAWGEWGERSDVDLVVEGLPDPEAAKAWGELERLLGTQVDLLRIEELPADFAARVREEGVPLP